MKKLLIAAAVAGTMVSGVAFADVIDTDIDGVAILVSADGVLNSPLCKVKNAVNIPLGDQNLKTLNTEGVVGHQTFQISLTECSTNYFKNEKKYTGVDVKFTGDANKITNSASSDAAENVVVRITKGISKTDILANGDNFRAANLSNGDTTLELGAEFYSENKNATAGKFSGSTQLTVYYK